MHQHGMDLLLNDSSLAQLVVLHCLPSTQTGQAARGPPPTLTPPLPLIDSAPGMRMPSVTTSQLTSRPPH